MTKKELKVVKQQRVEKEQKVRREKVGKAKEDHQKFLVVTNLEMKVKVSKKVQEKAHKKVEQERKAVQIFLAHTMVRAK